MRGEFLQESAKCRFEKASRQIVLTIACFLILSGCVTAIAFAQSPAGIVTEIGGSATVKRGVQVLPATEGMAIQQGDVLTTDRGAHLVVTLADQSKMQLGEGGTLAIDQAIVAAGSRNAVKVQLTSGRLRSLVSSALHGMSPNFQVRTPNMVAGVRGTDFEVSYSEGRPRFGFGECTQFTDVGVYNGLVEAANASGVGGSVLVDEGYETTVACAAAPTSPGPLGLTGTVLAPVLPDSEAPPPVPAAGTPPPAAPPPPLPPPPQ